MDFERIHLDYRNGQHEYVIVARDAGEAVGKLEYSFYEGVPYVKMIEAFKKGERVGTHLILELQQLYPDTPIEFGTLTEDGACLLESIEWACMPNDIHAAAKRDLETVRTKLSTYSERAENLVTASQEERDRFSRECSDWNDLYDHEDMLATVVARTQPEFRFAVGGKPLVGNKVLSVGRKP